MTLNMTPNNSAFTNNASLNKAIGGMDGVFKVPLPRRPQNVFRHAPTMFANNNLAKAIAQKQHVQRVLEARAAFN
jgi:uncharacterized protein (DUF924 family)